MENGQPTNGPQDPGLSLARILDDDNIEYLEQHLPLDTPAEGEDEELTAKQLEDGYCVECEGKLVPPADSIRLVLFTILQRRPASTDIL